MIATVTEIKTLLQISGSTYDTLIGSMVVPTQDWLVNHLKNAFLDSHIWYTASTIAFTASTITDSESKFVESDFVAGDYLIEGSKYQQSENRGRIVGVSTVAAGTLTLNSTYYTAYPLIAETAENSVTLTRVCFPNGLKLPFARLIQFDMSTRDKSLTSRSLADYSESYAGEGDYPPGLLRKLAPWKRVYW